MRKTDAHKFLKDPNNDYWIGPDECHYRTKTAAMYFSTGNCGCGQPSEIHRFMVDLLKQFDATEGWDNRPGWDGFVKTVEAEPELAAELIANALDVYGLTEHGGSVYGSWLTDRGKQFVQIGPMQEGDDEKIGNLEDKLTALEGLAGKP